MAVHGLAHPENRLHFVAKAEEFRSHGRLRHYAGSGVRAILYIAFDTAGLALLGAEALRENPKCAASRCSGLVPSGTVLLWESASSKVTEPSCVPFEVGVQYPRQ